MSGTSRRPSLPAAPCDLAATIPGAGFFCLDSRVAPSGNVARLVAPLSYFVEVERTEPVTGRLPREDGSKPPGLPSPALRVDLYRGANAAGHEMPCGAIRSGIFLRSADLAPPISPSVGLRAWSAMSGSRKVQAQACTPTRCRHVAPAGRFEPWAIAVPRPEDRSAGASGDFESRNWRDRQHLLSPRNRLSAPTALTVLDLAALQALAGSRRIWALEPSPSI